MLTTKKNFFGSYAFFPFLEARSLICGASSVGTNWNCSISQITSVYTELMLHYQKHVQYFCSRGETKLMEERRVLNDGGMKNRR